jgi:hypothetical protein
LGLLDNLIGTGIDDPRFAATTQLAQGLLSSPRLMQGLAQGVGGYQQAIAQARAQKAQEEERQMRLQMQQLQMQQAQAQAEKQKKLEALAGQFARTPQQMALGAEGKGPTNTALTASQGMAPGFDFAGYAQGLAGIDPMAALTMQGALRKETPAPLITKAGDVARDPRTGKVLWQNEDKPEAKPEALKALAAIYGEGSPEYLQAARQYAQKLTTHQPGTQVSLNTGQKGLDNTLKLRGEFRSEPVYKAYQEMQSAYGQIKQSLGLASPAGDLAGATKIMKLLDPGSVVRESELGMAMAATGALDRLTNYASMVVNGTKLTPDQRKDFQTLADRLYGESVSQYNAKRGEYQDIAERNGFSVPDVLGASAVAPKSAVVRTGTHNGRKVQQHADGTVTYAD